MPVSGLFETYTTRFIDPALGFDLGRNYWLTWATTLAVEMVAVAMIMQFWFPDTPAWVWRYRVNCLVVWSEYDVNKGIW